MPHQARRKISAARDVYEIFFSSGVFVFKLRWSFPRLFLRLPFELKICRFLLVFPIHLNICFLLIVPKAVPLHWYSVRTFSVFPALVLRGRRSVFQWSPSFVVCAPATFYGEHQLHFQRALTAKKKHLLTFLHLYKEVYIVFLV